MKRTFMYLLGVCLSLSMVDSVYGQQFKDASSAYALCALGNYSFDDLQGAGQEELRYYNLDCFSNRFEESNSIWMKFKIKESGTLTFIVSPEVEEDDIDFVVFKNLGVDRINLLPVRCMASGEQYSNQGIDLRNTNKSACNGPTGLSITSIDAFERLGCTYNDDSFLKYLSCKEGEEYYIVINNHSGGQGISMAFEGTCSLERQVDCDDQQSYSKEVDIKIYPNPAYTSINVEFALYDVGQVKVTFLDFLGRSVYSKEFEDQETYFNESFDLQNIPSGSYLIKVEQGSSTQFKQFIKI